MILINITLYYTVFPMPHVEEANKISLSLSLSLSLSWLDKPFILLPSLFPKIHIAWVILPLAADVLFPSACNKPA